MKQESHFLHKESCPACGSRDNLARYSDGHGHCFGCDHYEPGDGTVSERKKKPVNTNIDEYFSAQVEGLTNRGITEETCRHWGVRVGTSKGKRAHFYPYHTEAGIAGCKVRGPDKAFSWIGEAAPSLFGQNLWNSGKKLVITEGEIDALTVSQVQGNKWPVVSVPNGAQSAKKYLAKALDYLGKFDEVILMFDQDEPGLEAAKECAELLPAGRVKIASLPFKDPNDCLKNGKPDAIIQAIWNAKEYRPDGLVTVGDLMDDLDKPVTKGLPWFLDTLTALTFGRRWGEVYGFGAGTGIGKTDFLTQQIDYDISVLGQKVGLIFLEQKPLETVIRVAGKCKGKRFHVPDGTWEPEERKQAVAELLGKVVLYDSFGQTDWDVIKAKIRFMALSEGIRIFYLDHLTAMADTADEKGSLEQIMKEMAGLANELQIIIHFVSHLTTPEGKSHEEGGQVSIRHFKGSRAIGFWSYFMFGLERNQQAEDPVKRSITTFRVLKDRYTGQATGSLIYLGYDPETGRLFEKSDFDPEDDDSASEF